MYGINYMFPWPKMSKENDAVSFERISFVAIRVEVFNLNLKRSFLLMKSSRRLVWFVLPRIFLETLSIKPKFDAKRYGRCTLCSCNGD